MSIYVQLSKKANDVRAQIFGFVKKRHIIESKNDGHILYEKQVCRKQNCSLIAATYPDLCEVHAQDVYGCEVRDSTIPNAGKGLFALVPFSKEDTIDVYTGRYTKYSARDILPYGFYIPEHQCVVDTASTQSCLVRYINHSPDKANCKFIRFKPDGTTTLVVVVATTDIDVGEELFINYGSMYENKNIFKQEETCSIDQTDDAA